MTEALPPTTLYCANHPQRETNLRCNRCEKPICPSCAILTPTGYRCKECVRGIQKTYDNAQTTDYPIAFVIAAILSFLGSLIARYLGFFTIIIAPVAGVFIAEAIRLAVRKRRSRTLFWVAAAGSLTGCLPVLLLGLLSIFASGQFGSIFSIIWQVVYAGFVTTTVYTRLSGIMMRL